MNEQHSSPYGRALLGRLTSGRVLARSALWNFVGQGAPLVVAIAAIPFLIRALGVDRFGILTLAWMVVGYLSLLDLGLGRALTKLLAEELGQPEPRDLGALIWTALQLMLGVSAIGTAVTVVLTPWLVRGLLHVPTPLQGETVRAFYLVATSIPIVVGTVALRGVLEAFQRFEIVNAIKIPLGLLNFIGPVLVAQLSPRLDFAVGTLVAGRLVAGYVHYTYCTKVVEGIERWRAPERTLIPPLLAFGGWMTVSNVLGPLLVYLDRFLIGSLISVSAVAYYVTPYEIVTKLWLVPGALVGVLFPAFSTALSGERARATRLFERAQRYILLAMFPAALAVVFLAHPFLSLWLGPHFAVRSFRVLQYLAIGVFINSLAHVPFAFIQSAGRPDLTAKVHLLELPLYLLVLIRAVQSHGIEGAAAAWLARVAVDTALLLFLVRNHLAAPRIVGRIAFWMCIAVAPMALGCLVNDPAMKGVLMIGLALVFARTSWRTILEEDERALVRGWLHLHLKRRSAN